ncbi:hypothetical protein [Salinimonas chungwhensis]|uniref:hypothetical protein n=1 Tax=Salinimonas chungwhensis TaxID=265425 RepID=UPI000369A3CF|nr:hypothetical protein [Salinimonas chungwhensis]
MAQHYFFTASWPRIAVRAMHLKLTAIKQPAMPIILFAHIKINGVAYVAGRTDSGYGADEKIIAI